MNPEPTSPAAPPRGWQVGDAAPAPPPPRSEAEITSTWQDGPPVVSILCSTYEHRAFIEDALQGFLGQRTDFPFEVIVRDDASADGTAEVVADYAARYPSILRPVLLTENRWRQDRHRLQTLARGSFLARCEGDDYWTDPAKLQTQVERLLDSPDDVVSHHEAVVIEDGRIVQDHKLPAANRRDFTAKELVRAPWALTLTLVYRNVHRDPHPNRSQILNGDMFLLAQLGEHGGARWEADLLPAVYRRHPGGVWSARPPEQRSIDAARSYYWIGRYFVDRDADVASDFLARGLYWYVRGAREAGASPTALLESNDRLLRDALRSPREAIPARLRRLLDRHDRALRSRDDAKAKHRRLRSALDDARTRHRDARRHLEELQRRCAQLGEELATTRAQRDRAIARYERLRGRLLVRFALRIAELMRPLHPAIRRLRRGRGSDGSRQARR